MTLTPYVGQLAALGAASCWAVSALAFEAAGKRVGSFAVNVLRLVMASLILAALCWVLRGLPLPIDASAHAWLWLGISGLVGFTFGDLCQFQAFVVLGPRLTTLIMGLAPPLTGLIGWLLLGEILGPRQLLGMGLILAGIAWAILGPTAGGDGARPRLAGILLAAGGALGQAGGLVLSKLGMGTYDPFAATQVRILAGLGGYLVLTTLLRWWPRVRIATGHRSGLGFTALGSFFGPSLGVGLSLIAVRHTLAGVAASIMATTPLLIIPLVILLRREKVGVRGVGGAILVVGGVVLLFV
jgi:drug/metabolite transporter (DMT)-like permease